MCEFCPLTGPCGDPHCDNYPEAEREAKREIARVLAHRVAAALARRGFGVRVCEPAEWSGSPDPSDPDNFWIDDVTGERVSAATGERTPA